MRAHHFCGTYGRIGKCGIYPTIPFIYKNRTIIHEWMNALGGTIYPSLIIYGFLIPLICDHQTFTNNHRNHHYLINHFIIKSMELRIFKKGEHLPLARIGPRWCIYHLLLQVGLNMLGIKFTYEYLWHN